MSLRHRSIWLFVTGVIGSLAVPIDIEARVTVSFCQGQPGCICIDWDRVSSSYVEVRCPSGQGTSGWTNDPSGGDVDHPGDGGWRGPGGGQTSDSPGSPLTGALAFAWSRAKNSAWSKVRGDSSIGPTGKPMYTLNKCSSLFFNNPMGELGHNLIDNYIVGRNGEGMRGPDGTIPCDNPAVSIWTTCCNHDPDIFVCASFEGLSATMQIALLIHETMHVAGQTEDQTPTSGPGDAPTTSDITSTVREACGL